MVGGLVERIVEYRPLRSDRNRSFIEGAKFLLRSVFEVYSINQAPPSFYFAFGIFGIDIEGKGVEVNEAKNLFDFLIQEALVSRIEAGLAREIYYFLITPERDQTSGLVRYRHPIIHIQQLTSGDYVKKETSNGNGNGKNGHSNGASGELFFWFSDEYRRGWSNALDKNKFLEGIIDKFREHSR